MAQRPPRLQLPIIVSFSREAKNKQRLHVWQRETRKTRELNHTRKEKKGERKHPACKEAAGTS